jgi:hypothetical protein
VSLNAPAEQTLPKEDAARLLHRLHIEALSLGEGREAIHLLHGHEFIELLAFDWSKGLNGSQLDRFASFVLIIFHRGLDK